MLTRNDSCMLAQMMNYVPEKYTAEKMSKNANCIFLMTRLLSCDSKNEREMLVRYEENTLEIQRCFSRHTVKEKAVTKC